MPPSVLDLPPRRKVARSFYRRWTWRRQLIATGSRLVILATLALLILGGWYLANKGFGRQWRTTVANELRQRGVEASVRRLTLNPFRGLVAQDVRVYDFKDRNKLLAVISELSLDINYAALLHRQPFLNAVDIRNANVTFPNPAGDSRHAPATLQNFRAHVYFPPEQIFLSQAEGVFCGVRVSATGQLLKRSDYQPTRVVTEEEWRQRWQLVQRVADELLSFRFAGGPPSLQIKFSGDVAQMENARIEATLESHRLQRGAYEIKTFAAAAEWRDQRLNLAKLEWTDQAGSVSASATWALADQRGRFQISSSAQIKEMLEAFGFEKILADTTFAAPPLIEASGSFHFAKSGPRGNVLGRVEVGNFTHKDVPLLGLTAEYSWDGERTMLRDARLRHASGEVLADLLDTPGDFRLSFESSINPTAFRALAPDGLQEFAGEWEMPRSPAVRLAIHGSSRDPETWRGEGTVALQRTRFRGIWMDSLTADLRLEEKAVALNDLRVTRDEGVGTGAFTYDYGRKEVRLRDVQTTLRPADVIYWIEPKLFKVVTPYKFRAPPRLIANGIVQYQGGTNTHLEIAVDAPSGMDYFFLGRTLPFNRVRGDLLITDDRVQLIGLEGKLFDGTVRGNADIRTAKDDKSYSAKVALDGVDFPRLTDLYFKYETARGQLAGSYDFKGVGDDAKTMRGAGKIKVSNGDVFAIPVLGPLSGFIAEILPGAGYSVAKEATASFTIKDGIIHTDDFKVSGKLFGMVGHGDLHFLANKLDFEIRLDARGPGVLLTPVYELFEYKGEGSLSKPNWHPKRF
ncbi:MAG: AsmA-like C-terminal region-containing protein [Chthoniobacterales bacterium]